MYHNLTPHTHVKKEKFSRENVTHGTIQKTKQEFTPLGYIVHMNKSWFTSIQCP